MAAGIGAETMKVYSSTTLLEFLEAARAQAVAFVPDPLEIDKIDELIRLVLTAEDAGLDW